MTVIAVINQKGGVGKTTTAVNISYEMAKKGKKVLLVDLDPQGHSCEPYLSACHEYDYTVNNVMDARVCDVNLAIYPAYVNERQVNNLFIMPSNINLALVAEQLSSRLHREKILAKALKDTKSKYDYVILDCPPNLGVLAINGIYFASHFLIPVKPDKRALDGVSDLFMTVDEVKEGQKYKYCMFRIDMDIRNTQTNSYIDSELEGYKEYLLHTVIRRNEAINQAYIAGLPIQEYDPKGKGNEDFKALAEEIETCLN